MIPCSPIWRASKALCGALVVAALGSASDLAHAASRSPADFQQRAVVREGAPIAAGGAYAIALAPEAIAALRSDKETRLFDAGGREVPSLVHRNRGGTQHVDRPVSIYNLARLADGQLTVSVELEGRHVEAANEFRFELDADNYSLRVRVEGSQDGETWQQIADGLRLIRYDVTDERIRYAHDRLRIPTSRYRHYRFLLRSTLLPDPAAPPLRIEKVSLRETAKRGQQLSLPTEIEPYAGDRGAPRSEARTRGRVDEWRVDLGKTDLGVDRVTLGLRGTDFARSASVWEWSEERERRTRRLASGVIFHFDRDSQIELDGFATDARYLIVRIEQGDDAPVPLRSLTAHRPRSEVRFLAPNGLRLPLALYFEPEWVRTPSYDLARRLKEREVTDFGALSHEPLGPNPAFRLAPEPRSEQIPWLLTGVVLALVAGLGFFVARTIRQGTSEA